MRARTRSTRSANMGRRLEAWSARASSGASPFSGPSAWAGSHYPAAVMPALDAFRPTLQSIARRGRSPPHGVPGAVVGVLRGDERLVVATGLGQRRHGHRHHAGHPVPDRLDLEDLHRHPGDAARARRPGRARRAGARRAPGVPGRRRHRHPDHHAPSPAQPHQRHPGRPLPRLRAEPRCPVALRLHPRGHRPGPSSRRPVQLLQRRLRGARPARRGGDRRPLRPGPATPPAPSARPEPDGHPRRAGDHPPRRRRPPAPPTTGSR